MYKGRRAVFGLSLSSVGILAFVAAYQTGILKHLPGPAHGHFNAEKLHASPGAYPFGVPDAFFGIASYATTAMLSQTSTPSALSMKTALDITIAAAMTIYGWRKNRTFSIYSLLIGGASVVSFAVSLCNRTAVTPKA